MLFGMEILEIWRYPFKSMAGERLSGAEVGESGIPGDRAWALRQNGVTRNAKKYPALMSLRAHYDADPQPGKPAPAPVITFEDGRTMKADDKDASTSLSEFVGAEVEVSSLAPASDLDFYRRREKRSLDETRAILGLEDGEPFPDFSSLPASAAEFATPPGTFFDCFPILVMTDASLAALQAVAAESAIDVRRFRPNILVAADEAGFVESDWQGKRLKLGEAELALTMPCPRCVMTTVGFHDLPRDTKIMRHLVKACQQEFGIYANVTKPGKIRVGDRVQLG